MIYMGETNLSLFPDNMSVITEIRIYRPMIRINKWTKQVTENKAKQNHLNFMYYQQKVRNKNYQQIKTILLQTIKKSLRKVEQRGARPLHWEL